VPRYEWDPKKAAANLARHGVAFSAIHEFQWALALVRADTRHAEKRLIAFAPIGRRLHAAVFTIERRCVRIISLRKANAKETRRYDQEAPE
jgi:uncharacterized protein